MSMKKTDLVKNLAKKLDGKMKASGAPSRFGKGSQVGPVKGDGHGSGAAANAKPVLLSCRLPPHLAKALRERAVGHAGGINALITLAVQQWLDATPTE